MITCPHYSHLYASRLGFVISVHINLFVVNVIFDMQTTHAQVEALLVNGKRQNPESSPAIILSIQQIIMAINALSKVTDVLIH